MAIWLDTTGRGTLGIGVCDRCRVKMSIEELMPDPNSPGLRVCQKDLDQLDPYRLPARQVEAIALPFVRPDANLATNPLGLVTQDDNEFLITQDGQQYILPFP